MKIGELAKAARCTPETIRFYEKEGLMPDAERTDSNYRNYTDVHVERLRFIRNCRALDMAHDEIRALLQLTDTPADPCDSINSLLDEHIGHVDARLAELTHLRDQLTGIAPPVRRRTFGRGLRHRARSRDDGNRRPGREALAPRLKPL